MPIKSFIFVLVYLAKMLKTTSSTGDQNSNIREMTISATNSVTQSRISLDAALKTFSRRKNTFYLTACVYIND